MTASAATSKGSSKSHHGDRSNGIFRLAAGLRKYGARRIALWSAGSVLVVVAFCVGLLFTHLFALTTIDVEGNQQLDRNAVLAAAKTRVGQPLVTVNHGAIERRLKAKPNVASAMVSTSWPHTLKIEITERTIVGTAQTSNGKWARVGSDGTVVSIADNVPSGLPVFVDAKVGTVTGSKAPAGVAVAIEVAKALPESLGSRTTQIGTDGGNIRLGLNTGTIVEIGDLADLGSKLMAAAAIVSHADPNTFATIDVRSPHLPTTTAKGASASVSASGGSVSASTEKSNSSQPSSSASATKSDSAGSAAKSSSTNQSRTSSSSKATASSQ